MTGLALFIFAVLQVADIVLTSAILKAGGRELNPIVAAIMAPIGSSWGAVKYAGSIGGALAIAATGHQWALWAIVAGMAAVVTHNFGQMQRGRK